MATKEQEVRILLSKLCDNTRLMITSEKNETIDEFAKDIVKLFSIHGVSQQRELLKTFCEYVDLESHAHTDHIKLDIENHIKVFNCG